MDVLTGRCVTLYSAFHQTCALIHSDLFNLQMPFGKDSGTGGDDQNSKPSESNGVSSRSECAGG
jgi:hypothetical protein